MSWGAQFPGIRSCQARMVVQYFGVSRNLGLIRIIGIVHAGWPYLHMCSIVTV